MGGCRVSKFSTPFCWIQKRKPEGQLPVFGGPIPKNLKKHEPPIWQLINIPVSGKRHLRKKKSFFREPFTTPSPRPFVCSVRSGAIVAAAVVLANTVIAAAHLRWQACSSVKRKQSPSFALVTCACRGSAEPCNKLHGLSPVFRGSFAKLAPK